MSNDQPNILEQKAYLPGYEGYLVDPITKNTSTKDIISESFPRVQTVLDKDSYDFKYGLEDYGYYSEDFFYQDPLFLSFDIVLDTYQSPLFGMENSLSSFLDKYGEIPSIKNRVDIYNEFYDIVKRLFNVGNYSIDKNKSYYIASITGLDKITAKMVDYQKDKITITLSEDVSMVSSYMALLYNNLSYSYKDQKYIIPYNLLRFNMYIRVSDLRNMPVIKEKDGTTTKNYDKSSIVYYLRDCNFNFFDSKPFEADLSAGGWGASPSYNPSSIKFDVYYKSIDVEIYNPLLNKSLQNKGNLNNKATSLILDPDKGDLHSVFSNSLKNAGSEDNDKLKKMINSQNKVSGDDIDDPIKKRQSNIDETLSSASSSLKGIIDGEIGTYYNRRTGEMLDFESFTEAMKDTINNEVELYNVLREQNLSDFQSSTSTMFDTISDQVERSDQLREKTLNDIAIGNSYMLPDLYQDFLKNFLQDRFMELTGLPKITLMDPYGNLINQAELDARRNERAYYALNGVSVINNNNLTRNGSGTTTQDMNWKIDVSYKLKPQENLGSVPFEQPTINPVVLGSVPFEEPIINPVVLGKLNLTPPIEEPVNLGEIYLEPFIIKPPELGSVSQFTKPIQPIVKLDLMPDSPTIAPQPMGSIDTSFTPKPVEELGDLMPDVEARPEPDLGKVNTTPRPISQEELGNIALNPPAEGEVDLGVLPINVKEKEELDFGVIDQTVKEREETSLGNIDTTPRTIEEVILGDLYSNDVEPREVDLGYLYRGLTEKNILEIIYLYTRDDSFKLLDNVKLYDNSVSVKEILNEDKIDLSTREKSPFELVYSYDNKVDIKKTIENAVLYNNEINKINNLELEKIISEIKEKKLMETVKLYSPDDTTAKRLDENELLYEPVDKQPVGNLGVIEQEVIKSEEKETLGKLYYNDVNKKLLELEYLYSNEVDKKSIELGKLYDNTEAFVKNLDDGKRVYDPQSARAIYEAEYDIKYKHQDIDIFKIEKEDQAKFRKTYLYEEIGETNHDIEKEYIDTETNKKHQEGIFDGERLYDNEIKIEKEKETLRIDTDFDKKRDKIEDINIISENKGYIQGMDKYKVVEDEDIHKEILTRTNIYDESELSRKRKDMPVDKLYDNDEIKYEVEKETIRIDQSSKEKNIYDKLDSNDIIQTKEIKHKEIEEDYIYDKEEWIEKNFLTKYDRIEGVPREIESLDERKLYDNDEVYMAKELYDDKIDFEIKKQVEFEQHSLYDNDITEDKTLENKHIEMEIRDTGKLYKTYLYNNEAEKTNELKEQVIDKEIFDRKTLNNDKIYMESEATGPKQILNGDEIYMENEATGPKQILNGDEIYMESEATGPRLTLNGDEIYMESEATGPKQILNGDEIYMESETTGPRLTLNGDEIYTDDEKSNNTLNGDRIDDSGNKIKNESLNGDRIDTETKENTNNIEDTKNERLG